jgi:hypothetical protein
MLTRVPNESMDIEGAERWNEEMERREANAEKGYPRPAPPIEKRRRRDAKQIPCLTINRDAWKLLVAGATMRAVRLETFCAFLLEMFASDLDIILGTSSLDLEILQMKARKHQEWIGLIESMVLQYTAHPTAAMADNIAKQCDRLGIDFNEIVDRVKGDPLSEIASEFNSDPDTKTNQCAKWVRDLMEKNGYRVSAKIANSLGVEAGFSKDMLALTRRRLSIQSVPEGREYWWVLPKSRRAARSILSGEDVM